MLLICLRLNQPNLIKWPTTQIQLTSHAPSLSLFAVVVVESSLKMFVNFLKIFLLEKS